MRVNDKGEIIQNDVTVEEFTKDLVVPLSQRKKAHEALYSQEPLLQIKNLKTHFPYQKWIFRRDYRTCKGGR